MQAVVQGAFVLAKASGDSRVAADALAHLRRYLASELPATDEPAALKKGA
jgi:hypothetical protein